MIHYPYFVRIVMEINLNLNLLYILEEPKYYVESYSVSKELELGHNSNVWFRDVNLMLSQPQLNLNTTST